jgi:hypothetical protein
MPSISKIIAVLALLHSSERNFSNAGLLSGIFGNNNKDKTNDKNNS